ncbi:UMP kinase [Candidatus Micrarchaeota archaeon]|nr:UMP kinase [Candidatus Micrarchaeota archaeon]
MKIVISLGGSLVYKDGIDLKYLRRFDDFVSKIKHPVAVSVGGGKIAREYVEKGRALGANNFELDEISIQLVKANSRLVSSALKKSLFFEDFDEAKNHFIAKKSLIVLGMGTPGQTSDSTSALFAEEVEADRWVNLSNVDAIYDRNPSERGAKKFKTMTHAELVAFADKHDSRRPRENFIIDSLAAKILARSNIEAHFVNGEKLSDAMKAVRGERHGGTVVRG